MNPESWWTFSVSSFQKIMISSCMRIATNVLVFPEDTTTSVPRVYAVNKYPLPDKVVEALSDMCREEEAPSGTYKMGYDSPLWKVGIGVGLQLAEVLMHEEIGGSSCVLFYILEHEEIAALGLDFSDVLWCCKPYISVTETAKLPQWKGWLEHLRIKNKNEISNKPFGCLQSKRPIRAR